MSEIFSWARAGEFLEGKLTKARTNEEIGRWFTTKESKSTCRIFLSSSTLDMVTIWTPHLRNATRLWTVTGALGLISGFLRIEPESGLTEDFQFECASAKKVTRTKQLATSSKFAKKSNITPIILNLENFGSLLTQKQETVGALDRQNNTNNRRVWFRKSTNLIRSGGPRNSQTWPSTEICADNHALNPRICSILARKFTTRDWRASQVTLNPNKSNFCIQNYPI